MNMSYCRFENTYRDLLDCYHDLKAKSFKDDLSNREQIYRNSLIELCKDIADEFEIEDIDEDDE